MLAWDEQWNRRARHLAEAGLYDPLSEHDACGVGFVAAIDGKPRRAIVEAGIEALKAVYHRGAVDADGKTGDGAGIHIQIPGAFFEDHLRQTGQAPTHRPLAVGMLFLPRKNLAAQEMCRSIVESEISRLGYTLHGWRQVPVRSEVIGMVAAESRPEIEQVLIVCREGVDEARFELELYFIRKRIENAVRAQAINEFYICSLSCRSVIYKGLFKAEQLTAFYPDLLDARFISSYAIFHQRFSTNTAPAWHLAQPFRMLAHNGEINTLKGNANFMKSHEATFHCDAFAGFEQDLLPVIPDNTSDTGALDAVVEILTRAGRPLPLAKLILIPPVWSADAQVSESQRRMFMCLNSVSEQWDGPAAIAATDGEWVIAGMDRSGLRPLRYTITKDGMLAICSESGMVRCPESDIVERGRLGPGEIIGIHLREGALYKDEALKERLAAQYPYADWAANIVNLADILSDAQSPALPQGETLRRQQLAAGLTLEELEMILYPMAEDGKEAVGSMGDDTPLAALSEQYRGFHHFFRQNFSQVTNPPIDSLRERRVMSLRTRFGNDGNYLALDASHSKILLAETPVLLSAELEAIKRHFARRATELDTLFELSGSLRQGIDRLVRQAEEAVRSGHSYLVLTDERMDAARPAIPMILAASAVHSALVRQKLRKKAAILVRTSECMDVHGCAVLIGCGATVVNPYLAEAAIADGHRRGIFKDPKPLFHYLNNYRDALSQGLLKIMAKMGISIVSAYRGGLNFEAIGLSRALVAEFFPGLPSRISGIGLDCIETRQRAQHAKAFAGEESLSAAILPIGGFYRFRASGEQHGWEAAPVHLLQRAVEGGSYPLYKRYAETLVTHSPLHLRDLLDFRRDLPPLSLEQVEPASEICKRFVAPAMSLGALSPEAHRTLAIAMHRIGAASNSGEGGEGAERYRTPANSSIKQVASARFGVTAEYLNSASELQIKVAQGAKPGEGGQLPGFKVTTEIARLRHATPGVMLISPPPHHDIYSIEDLAQLIYDLKQINPDAMVSVKLVAQSGIGTIASGVAKAMADKIVIAGFSGGTGAAGWSSIKHTGIPWEMGLAEANQVLTLNRLRHRVKLQTDGGLKTGRDIVIAAMLGAEEYAIGTAALVAMGCLMVRQCHSNTCPVGITTQNPALREKFSGTVEKVVNLFRFIAEDVREILAALGFSRLEDIVGRADLLKQVSGRQDGLDLNTLLAQVDSDNPRFFALAGHNAVADSLDVRMLDSVQAALERGEKIQLDYAVTNTMRTIGTRLSSLMVRQFDCQALAHDQVTLRLSGSAGQSLGAFCVQGLKIEMLGDANDYVGKGLSGGTIVVRPSPASPLAPEDNTIVGNTVLYGATSGKLFACGQAGERFAVRNSSATAVVEGCGSNACEYMTAGLVAILGEVGHNFGAGMTGGMAFVYDAHERFADRVNADTLVYQRLASAYWEETLKNLLSEHARETASPLAARLLSNWETALPDFWQVCPKEMVNRLEHPLTEDGAVPSVGSLAAGKRFI